MEDDTINATLKFIDIHAHNYYEKWIVVNNGKLLGVSNVYKNLADKFGSSINAVTIPKAKTLGFTAFRP